MVGSARPENVAKWVEWAAKPLEVELLALAERERLESCQRIGHPHDTAARLERNGQIKPGDEVTMVSAAFGDEMWSSRGVGKYRLEKSIAVRQGMSISFVVESSSDSKKRNMQQFKKKRDAEAERMTRLQKQLAQEVEDDKKKGGLFGGLFN